MITLRTGIDLIELHRLEEISPAIRERFLLRVFTTAELEDTGGALHSLSGRFAAKEAVAKALGCGIGPVSWKDIEILNGSIGEPILKLHGNAVKIAAEMHLEVWSISISHSRTQAVAVAVAAGEIISHSP